MSQKNSSSLSPSMTAENAEIKYKKALKEIYKLMAANRALRENSEKGDGTLKNRIQELSLRYEQLQRQNKSLQIERNTLNRQITYLNQVVTEQGTSLSKYNLQSDERAIANLIRTYEEKEKISNKNITEQDEIINKYKNYIEKQDNRIAQLQEENKNLQNKYNQVTMEINRYRELNQTLMSQNQRILMEHSCKEEGLTEKQKQLQILANQFRSQISLLKNTTQINSSDGELDNKFTENIQQILGEKNRISIQFTKLREAYQELTDRQKYYYEIQEKLKMATIKAERAIEEANMLKSKIVVLEAKQFLEEAGEDDYGQKQFEERLAMLITQNDPINVLRNSDDTSHFKILKSFLVDLQDKIYRINNQKTEVTRKYKSIRNKFVKNTKNLTYFEDQNKLLKGKIEGYERLTEKLQYQLEKALATHDQQITRMSITSNNILTKKTEDYKATITLLNSQIQVSQQKLDKVQKNLKQQNDTLRLESQTLRMKFNDTSQKSNKQSEFIELYKKKNQQMTTKINKFEQEITELNQNCSRWERLFRQQKSKSQGLISQKQQLNNQNRQLVEQLDRKTHTFNQSLKTKQNYSETQIKKLRNQITQLKDQLQYTSRQLQKAQRDVDDHRAVEQSQVEQIKKHATRNLELQQRNNQFRKKIRTLEDQNQTLKLKGKKYMQNYDKNTKVQEQLLHKNDKINDLLREKLTLENQLKLIHGQTQDQRKQNQQMKKQLAQYKLKSMDSVHELRRDSENKNLQNKKIIQNLNQQLSDLSSQIRQEKSKNMRLSNQINNLKSEKNRIQELVQQNRKKDLQAQGQLGDMKLQVYEMSMENQKLKNQTKNQQLSFGGLNQQIQSLQQKIYMLNQQISGYKMKIQTTEDEKNDMTRDLNSMKFNFANVQGYINKLKAQMNLKWEEETFANSCSEILNKIRRIGRNYGVTFENGSPITSFNPSVTDINKVSVGGTSSYQYFKSYSRGGEAEAGKIDSARGSSSSMKPLQSNFNSSQNDYLDFNPAANKDPLKFGTRNTSEQWMNPTYNYLDNKQSRKPYESPAI